MLELEEENSPYGVAPPPDCPAPPSTYPYACVLCLLGMLQRIFPFVLFVWGFITMVVTFENVPDCAEALRPYVGIALSSFGVCALFGVHYDASWANAMRFPPRERKKLCVLLALSGSACISIAFLTTICSSAPEGLLIWCWSAAAYLVLVVILLFVVWYYAQ